MSNLVALVTGASSGMGQETALALHKKGVTVYAAARRPMPELADRGIHTMHMDVTDEESVQGGVQTILDAEGYIDILVNDAGYGSYGSIEDVPMSEARHQFDVNVFGAMRLIQLVLPQMIDRGRGRIVNISSMGGRFAMALGGWYHATKYALEALSDSLRQEVGSLGVDVVLVEPGLIHTNWSAIAAKNLRATSGLGKYAVIAQNFAAALDFAGRGLATDPAVLGRTIAHAATTKHPRTRYRKGMGSLAITTLLPHIPDRVFDLGVHLFLTHMDTLLSLVDKKN